MCGKLAHIALYYKYLVSHSLAMYHSNSCRKTEDGLPVFCCTLVSTHSQASTIVACSLKFSKFGLSRFQYIVIEEAVYAEVHLLLFSVFGVSIYRNRATCMQRLHCRTLAWDLMSAKFGPTSPKYHRPIVRRTRLLNTIDQSSKVPPRYKFESIEYVSYILQKIWESFQTWASLKTWWEEKKVKIVRGKSSLELELE